MILFNDLNGSRIRDLRVLCHFYTEEGKEGRPLLHQKYRYNLRLLAILKHVEFMAIRRVHDLLEKF